MTYTGVYENRGIKLDGLVYSGNSIRGTFDYDAVFSLNLALHETNVHDIRYGPIKDGERFNPQGENFGIGIYVPIEKLKEVNYPGDADPNLTLIEAFEGLEREIQEIEAKKAEKKTVKVGLDHGTKTWCYGAE